MIDESWRYTRRRISSRFMSGSPAGNSSASCAAQGVQLLGRDVALQHGHLHDSQHVDEVPIADEVGHQLAAAFQHREGVLWRRLGDQQRQRALDEDALLIGVQHGVAPLLGRTDFQQAARGPGFETIVRGQQRNHGVGRRLLLGAHDGFHGFATHEAIRVFEQIEQAFPRLVAGIQPHQFGRLGPDDFVLVAGQFQEQRDAGRRTVELHQVERTRAVVRGIGRAAGHAQQHWTPVFTQALLHFGDLLTAPGAWQLRLANGRRDARTQIRHVLRYVPVPGDSIQAAARAASAR